MDKKIPSSTQNKKNVYVCTLSNDNAEKLHSDLTQKGFEFYEVPYAKFGARHGKTILTLYTSNKLVIQGKEAKEFIEFYLEPDILKNTSLTYNDFYIEQQFEKHIGVDESGKGDYFGPLVIASAYIEKDQVSELLKVGIKDCKKISDKKVTELYQFLRKKITYSLVTIGPERYNELYQKITNLNRMLAWGHARAIENLLQKVNCQQVLIDKFCKKNLILEVLMKRGKKVKIEQRTKAEEDIVVAAASVLARGEFLFRLEQQEKEFGIPFPRGASKKVEEAAADFIKKEGMSALNKVAKLHFKTTKKVIMD
ncbi:ribonuclease HIII [Chlamydiota bacterium]